MTQLSFDTAPYQSHSATSKAAAEAIWPKAGTLRRRVLDWLWEHGPSTDEEMQVGIPMEASTQRPRRIELVDAGLVRDSGERRETRAGRKATVWEAK